MDLLTLAALDFPCLDGRRGLRGSGATRNEPQLNTVFLTVATVHNRQPRSIDAALRNHIVARTIHQLLDLAHRAHPPTIGDDISAGSRVVLQLDCKVVETCLLIVKRALVTLVKLTCNDYNLLDRRDI